MPTHSAEYVSLLGLGDPTRATATMSEIAATIRKRNAEKGRAVNFSLRVLLGPEHAEAELIEPSRLAPITKGVYPVVWLNLTFDPALLPAAQLVEWAQRFQLRLTARGTSSLDILGLGTPPEPSPPSR